MTYQPYSPTGCNHRASDVCKHPEAEDNDYYAVRGLLERCHCGVVLYVRPVEVSASYAEWVE